MLKHILYMSVGAGTVTITVSHNFELELSYIIPEYPAR